MAIHDAVIAVEYVFQELDYLPEGLTVPEGRVKPWGTNHAVMMAAKAIHEPFAVINADDFYGAEAYRTIGDYLAQLDGSRNRYCMVAYDLNRTQAGRTVLQRDRPPNKGGLWGCMIGYMECVCCRKRGVRGGHWPIKDR